jgi:hypothetical protein
VNYIDENVAIYKLVKEVTTTPMEDTAKYNLYRGRLLKIRKTQNGSC